MKNVFSLGLETFNTGIKEVGFEMVDQRFSFKIVDGNGNISYGAFGRFVHLDDEAVGFQAVDQRFSYGWQVDGSFIENGKKVKIFNVMEQNERNFDEHLLFSGTWSKAVEKAINSDRPCYIISAYQDILYSNNLTNLQPEIKFTNKAWNQKNK